MAISRALRDVMRGENGFAGTKRSRGTEHSHEEESHQRHAKGEEVKWMQDIHPKKGALHKELGIPVGKKISTGRLEKATHSDSPLERKRANLALRYRGK